MIKILTRIISTWLMVMLFMTLPESLFAQSQDRNYVMTIEPDNGSATEPNTNNSNARVTIDYVDGLGRSTQNVVRGAGGNGEDVITLTEYNLRNLPEYQWLPTAVNGNGDFKGYSSLKSAAKNFYGSDQRPFVHTHYDDGMSKRVKATHKPGKEWANKFVKYDYTSNENAGGEAKYVCRKFIVDVDGRSLYADGYYSKGTLHITEQTDEDGRKTLSFADMNGRKVLERRVSAQNSFNDTHYVYDYRGLLRFIISPEATTLFGQSDVCDQGIINSLCYFFDYDLRGRMIEKCLPGAQPIYYVYNKLNQPIFYQDGNQRLKSEWSVIKYDSRHRKAIEGYAVISGATRQSLQEQWGNSLLTETPLCHENYEPALFYSCDNGPGNFVPTQAWFYDNYDHWGGTSALPTDASYPINMNLSACSMQTGSAVVDNGNVSISAIVYDDKKRVVLECERDYFKNDHGHTTFYRYSHRGLLKQKKHSVYLYAEGTILDSHSAEWEYTHDRGDRIVTTRMRIDAGDWHTLSTNTYDAIGRLSSTSLVENAGYKKATYTYDTQNRITQVNAPFLFEQLFYASNPYDSNATVNYNGNLNAAYYSMYDDSSGTRQLSEMRLGYTYDTLDRLTAMYDHDSEGSFGETMEYDANSNITHLTRRFDGTTVQDMAITHDGNHIVSMYDVSSDLRMGEIPQIPSGDYTDAVDYDANGNMTRDDSRQISSITYHRNINLPKKLTFTDGSYVAWDYRADGVKRRRSDLKKIITVVTNINANGDTTYTTRTRNSTTTRTYIGEWERIGNNLWRIPTGTGHCDIDTQSDTKKHRIYVRDHLGSTRAVIDEAGELLQTVNYYASGVPFTLTQGETATDRLHSGKQFIDHQGLGYYDNSARMLDVLGGRFTTLDPMATDYGHLSPYSNCAANPLKYTDPDGRILRDENGNIVYVTTGETSSLKHSSGAIGHVQIGHIFANDRTPIEVYKNIGNEVEWDTNCHGTTFADGKYWINPNQVKNILKGDNYSYIPITDAQKGDKIIYNDDSFADHSMTIIETNGTLEETIVYGQGGLDVENQSIEAINAWTNPQKHLIARQQSKDVVVTNEEIITLSKQQYE